MKAVLGQPSSSKTSPPSAKTGSAKEVGIQKTAQLKARPGLCGTLEIGLALEKLVGLSKMLHQLDVVASFHELRAAGIAVTRTTRVPAFGNLGDDSSPNVHKTPSSEWMMENHASLSPMVVFAFLPRTFYYRP
jgi:hypothetical protein